MTSVAGRPALQPTSRPLARLVALAVSIAAFWVGVAFAEAPLAATLIVLGALALIVSLARPGAATYVVIVILYSNAAGVAVRDHGLPQLVGIAFPLLLALPLAEQLVLRRKPVVVTAGLPFLFGYLLVQVLAAIGARDPVDATDSLVGFLISGFGLYFVITNVVRTYGSLRLVTWTVLLVGAGMGALSTYQAVTETYRNDYLGFSTVDLPGQDSRGEHLVASLVGTPRAEGPIGETNRYGQVMLVLLPLGAFLALGERRRGLRWLALFLTALILCGMATTFSRGAALGLVAVLGVAVAFRYLRLVHLGLLGLLLVAVLAVFPRYSERLVDLQGLASIVAGETADAPGDTGNLRGRLTATLAALYVWEDHPLLGVGRGQFDKYYPEYAGLVAETTSESRVAFGEERQAHNLYTSVAAETGTLGFLAFFAVFLVTMAGLEQARRRWRHDRPEVSQLAMGFLLALVAYLVSGIALHLSYERYLWFLLALAGVAATLALRGDPARDLEIGPSAGWRRVRTASQPVGAR